MPQVRLRPAAYAAFFSSAGPFATACISSVFISHWAQALSNVRSVHGRYRDFPAPRRFILTVCSSTRSLGSGTAEEFARDPHQQNLP